jgi:hypothetical protein
MMQRRRRPDITLTRAFELPCCLRCGSEGLLSASVPASPASSGEAADEGDELTEGRPARVVVLCPTCDVGDSAAGPLILFFAVHGRVTAPTAEQFAGLLRTWADHAVRCG